MKLMHGSRKPLALHIGLCLTDNRSAAFEYARDGAGRVHHITAVELDMYELEVYEVDGLGESGARGDTAEDLAALAAEGIDVIVFDDESYNCVVHRTWRIISRRALDRVQVLGPAK